MEHIEQTVQRWRENRKRKTPITQRTIHVKGHAVTVVQKRGRSASRVAASGS